ncbi:ferredoxin, partial [Streptomyces sp. NPDC003233]
MRIAVDLNRCQGYAQCVYLAHDVFRLNGQEALTYEPNPDDERRLQV